MNMLLIFRHNLPKSIVNQLKNTNAMSIKFADGIKTVMAWDRASTMEFSEKQPADHPTYTGMICMLLYNVKFNKMDVSKELVEGNPLISVLNMSVPTNRQWMFDFSYKPDFDFLETRFVDSEENGKKEYPVTMIQDSDFKFIISDGENDYTGSRI